jgi:Domain of unknown function (DUF4868)
MTTTDEINDELHNNNNDDDTGNIIHLSPEQSAAQKALERIFALDLSQCAISVCLASEQSGSDVPRFRRADLMDGAVKQFHNALERALETTKKDFANKDLILRPFEPDSAVVEGTIEYLQISHYTSLKEQIAPLENFAGMENLHANESAFVRGLRFYSVIVEPPPTAEFHDPIYYYRWYSHSFLLSDSAHHAIRWRRHKDTYDVIREPVFLFDRHVDCFSQGDQMFVLQKYYFYTIFRLEEEMKKTAEKALDELQAMDLIHRFQLFKNDCLKNKNKYRILCKIYHKPYFRTLTVEMLEHVISEYQRPIKVEYIPSKHKKKLVYSQDEPWAILHLLDDQYFTSPLTQIDYQAEGKNEVRHRRSHPHNQP